MKLNSKTLILLQIFFFVSLSNITYSQNKANSKSIMNKEIATFGSGCFWCTEAIFERVDGVKTVEPGFAGGTTKNPTYKEVVSGETGHAEVTQITFNPEKISYEDLLEIFWQTHDPTTLNRQGADYGTQYRSAIFCSDDTQKQIATKYLDKLSNAGIWDDPIVTEIQMLDTFYPAESYHKDYYERNPYSQYCNVVITPKVEKFEKVFSDKLKK